MTSFFDFTFIKIISSIPTRPKVIKAPRNGIVIGGYLYLMVKSLDDYYFKPMQDYSVGLRYSYPVYSVTRKD